MSKRVLTDYSGDTPSFLGYLLFWLLALAASPGDIQAQKPEKQFIRHGHSEGTMFFIRPQMFKTTEGQKGEADFTFDQRDTSASRFTMAFTLPMATALRNLDSVQFVLGGKRLLSSADTERYFVEPKGKKTWINRYAVRTEPEAGISWLSGPGERSWVLFSGQQRIECRIGRKEGELLAILAQLLAVEAGL